MGNHNENTKRLLELIRQNPGLRVFPMVETEVVADDTCTWWGGQFGSCSVDEVFFAEDRYYIRSEDEEDLISGVLENSKYDLMATEAAERDAEKVVNAYDWEKVILVNITTP